MTLLESISPTFYERNCTNFLVQVKNLTFTSSTKKLRTKHSYEKATRKMLMKMTPIQHKKMLSVLKRYQSFPTRKPPHVTSTFSDNEQNNYLEQTFHSFDQNVSCSKKNFISKKIYLLTHFTIFSPFLQMTVWRGAETCVGQCNANLVDGISSTVEQSRTN